MSCSNKSIRPKQWSHGLTQNPLLAEENPVHNTGINIGTINVRACCPNRALHMPLTWGMPSVATGNLLSNPMRVCICRQTRAWLLPLTWWAIREFGIRIRTPFVRTRFPNRVLCMLLTRGVTRDHFCICASRILARACCV